jgi:hypothetical protein
MSRLKWKKKWCLLNANHTVNVQSFSLCCSFSFQWTVPLIRNARYRSIKCSHNCRKRRFRFYYSITTLLSGMSCTVRCHGQLDSILSVQSTEVKSIFFMDEMRQSCLLRRTFLWQLTLEFRWIDLSPVGSRGKIYDLWIYLQMRWLAGKLSIHYTNEGKLV